MPIRTCGEALGASVVTRLSGSEIRGIGSFPLRKSSAIVGLVAILHPVAFYE